jgi:predicted nucleotidyltransferase
MGEKEYIKKEISKFMRRLSKDFRIVAIIWFGSRAEGIYKKWSDIDLIIVSDDFENMNFFERVSKMYDYWELDLPVDFLCYTKKEFDILKRRISIAKMALEKGIVIKKAV